METNQLEKAKEVIEKEILAFINKKQCGYFKAFDEAVENDNYETALKSRTYSLGWSYVAGFITRNELFEKMTIEDIEEFTKNLIKHAKDKNEQ